MNEIDLSEMTAVKSIDRLREIAEGVQPGKGIPVSEVSAAIRLHPRNIIIHAKRLGCYQIVNIKGKPTAFITSLKP